MPATPAMPVTPATPAGRPPEVSALFSRGRLTAIPRREVRRGQLLEYLATTLFEPDREYGEREVNEALLTVHEDFSALRRYLVEAGWLIRHPDGSRYWRADLP